MTTDSGAGSRGSALAKLGRAGAALLVQEGGHLSTTTHHSWTAEDGSELEGPDWENSKTPEAPEERQDSEEEEEEEEGEERANGRMEEDPRQARLSGLSLALGRGLPRAVREEVTPSPSLARSPAMHEGFLQRDWR